MAHLDMRERQFRRCLMLGAETFEQKKEIIAMAESESEAIALAQTSKDDRLIAHVDSIIGKC